MNGMPWDCTGVIFGSAERKGVNPVAYAGHAGS